VSACQLALDGTLFVAGWAVASTRARHGLPAHPAIVDRRPWVLALRLALVNVVPVVAMGAGLPLAALLAVLPGLVVDRFAFYALAAIASTEAEEASVERAIPQRSRTRASHSSRKTGASSPSPTLRMAATSRMEAAAHVPAANIPANARVIVRSASAIL
jgi:hypothetical protein